MRQFQGMVVALLLIAGTLPVVAGEGILTVKTDPDGIEVWLGDDFLGQSPIVEKRIKAGRYVLRLIDPAQHSSATEDLFIKDGDTAVVERALTSQFGRLKITSTPEGADVFIFTELGKTPLTNDFMNPGKYRVEIRPMNSRYLPAISEATIQRGETITIQQQLKKQRFLSKKNIISIILLAGVGGGFAWSIVEQGHFKMYKQSQADQAFLPASMKQNHQSDIDGAALNRVVGIIIGSTCAVGLGLIALF